jgi:zinc-ribbon domain
MKRCSYCGHTNLDEMTDCVKCGASLAPLRIAEVKTYRFGPEKGRELRKKALGYFVLGLMVKVYWGGYGTWTPYDTDLLMSLRQWVQPVLLYGGALAYVMGWVINWI